MEVKNNSEDSMKDVSFKHIETHGDKRSIIPIPVDMLDSAFMLIKTSVGERRR